MDSVMSAWVSQSSHNNVEGKWIATFHFLMMTFTWTQADPQKPTNAGSITLRPCGLVEKSAFNLNDDIVQLPSVQI